jgi:hypothetical protein
MCDFLPPTFSHPRISKFQNTVTDFFRGEKETDQEKLAILQNFLQPFPDFVVFIYSRLNLENKKDKQTFYDQMEVNHV